MNIKLLSTLVLALMVISFPVMARGQSLGSKNGHLGQKAGQSKLGAGKQTSTNNMPGKQVNSNAGRDQGFGNNSNKSYNNRNDSVDNKGNWHGGYDGRHGKYHHDRGHHKFNPLYAPFYYFGYYGYAPYAGYYAYVDPDYPLGYGTTMGTSLQRPSNLEVNQFFSESAPAPADYSRDNSDAGYTYTGPPDDAVVEYYNPPPSEEQTIYVWVDESGVRNYVNDFDLVPPGYRDIVTILGAE